MDEQSRIAIPPSFFALYSKNGRPLETRAAIEARYDLCEDLASQTAEVCTTLQFKDDLSERDVLMRCHESLQASGAVSEPEAAWVIARVAELLQWAAPDFVSPAASPPA